MPLKYAAIPESSLGTVEFVKHLETVGRQVRRGRRTTTIPEIEIYEVMSAERGSFTVSVPTKEALKGDFYKKVVRLVDPRVVIKPITSINDMTGEIGARARLFVEAEKIELIGGVS